MNSLALPRNVRNLPSVQALQDKLVSAKNQNKSLREQAKDSVDQAQSLGGTCVGAAITGALIGYDYGDGVIGGVAGALAVAGVAFGQPLLVHTAGGVIAPLLADFVSTKVRTARTQPSVQPAA